MKNKTRCFVIFIVLQLQIFEPHTRFLLNYILKLKINISFLIFVELKYIIFNIKDSNKKTISLIIYFTPL